MSNERAEERLHAADVWYTLTPEALEAERLRRIQRHWVEDMKFLFHTLNPAKYAPPAETFDPGSKWQQLEERCARIEQEIEELAKLLK